MRQESEQIRTPETQTTYVVAIGASAGGLEAIQNFFDHLDEDLPAAYVIIQHLSPDHKSLLVELISKRTELSVQEAKHDQQVEPQHVYVIPPGKMLTIKSMRLQLSEKVTTKSNHAIDIFLNSLAADVADNAVAIILSGTGTDGTKGISAIYNAGGYVFIQEPETAGFDGMPRSAMGSGVPSTVVPPEEMPYELLQAISSDNYPNFNEQQPDESTVKTIIFILRQVTGCDFSNYKQPTLLRRLARRMSLLRLSSVKDYLQILRESDEEPRMLCKDFLIGVTRFFRDEEAFQSIYTNVLPDLLKQQAHEGQFKVWVPACSTGEEAYTIAILIDRFLRERQHRVDVKIFATDIDAAAIDIAARGSYPISITSYLSPEIVKQYFIVRDDTCQILPSIRKQIVFARHDITSDPPFIKNHLISCRNMLIYMNPTLQKKVLNTLQYSLEPNGYLMLGPTESLGTAGASLEEIDRRWKVFRKKADATRGALSFLDYYGSTSLSNRNRPQKAITPIQRSISDDLHLSLVEDLSYAALYINRNFDIKEAVGAYEHYLSLPEKRLQLNLLKMVSPELAGIITSAVQQARSLKDKVVVKNASYREGDVTRILNLVVRPADPAQGSEIMMVVLGASTQVSIPELPERDDNDNDRSQLLARIHQLEVEGKELRSSLQTAVEGLESTNEMLHSTNEELLSSNEELQSSNEELQSLNEELHTLNTEHQLKIQELIQVNDDLNNFFRSTDIGQIFLDKGFRVRKFNSAATSIVHLIEGDIGRPITDIANRLQYGDLSADLREVMNTGKAIEREVKQNSNRTSIMRILPYLKQGKEHDGIIITFVDTTELKELDNIIRSVFDATLSGIIAMKAVRRAHRIVDFTVSTANKTAINLLGHNRSEIVGESFRSIMIDQVENGFLEKYINVVESGKPLHSEVSLQWNGETGWYTVVAVKMGDGIVLTFTDINARKESEEQMRAQYNELMSAREALKSLTNELEEKVRLRTKALSDSEERFRLITTGSNDALWDWNITVNSFWWSDSFYNQFGYQDTKSTESYHFWLSCLRPEERNAVRHSLESAINKGSTQWTAEHGFLKKDGTFAQVLDRAYILKDENGTPHRILGSMLDISQLRAAQADAAAFEAYSRKLEHVNMELEQSNHALQQFASVASHDLKEPVRKIEILSGMLQRMVEDEVLADYIARIKNASARMTGLINDLLDYSSLANVPSFQPTDLNLILAEVLSDLEMAIKDKDVLVHCDELPTIDAVPGQMRQVFQNILSNAIKFSKADVQPVISIKCKRTDRHIDGPEVKNGAFLQIDISDNGIGFEMQYATRIFTIFQRLHSRDKYQGTGIGLAIVKKIMDVHQGFVTVESELGTGTTFKLLLPVHIETAALENHQPAGGHLVSEN